MSPHPTLFCGVAMTADTYDDDIASRAYVLQHFPHLMTPLERRVVAYSAPFVSDSDHAKILKLHQFLEDRDGHVDDTEVLNAFRTPYEDRVANVVDRVLETRRGDLVENRCSKCHRLVCTPVAKQCLWCGHDWH
jgi:hypothetical protein